MKIVCVSGYFDPFHVGHLEYLEKSKKIGDYLFVIVNSDYQAKLKKKKSFMDQYERLKIIRSLKCVDAAIIAVDKDRTVRETLRIIKPDFFTNGGDQNNTTIPEIDICRELEIDLVDGLGDKIQSSSWLIKSAKEQN
jgi:D-beta-D-heptose 7-phosphate kinase/D-beta-D-heptose 1-phosphate adenosyltransferase